VVVADVGANHARVALARGAELGRSVGLVHPGAVLLREMGRRENDQFRRYPAPQFETGRFREE
jgi:hypothetical protein